MYVRMMPNTCLNDAEYSGIDRGWIEDGSKTDPRWIEDGSSMDRVWTEDGSSMDSLGLSTGAATPWGVSCKALGPKLEELEALC